MAALQPPDPVAWERKFSRSGRVLLASVSGLALAAAFPSYNAHFLAWVCVAGLIIAVARASPGRAALLGLLYGIAFYTATLPWIYTVMRVHGGLSVIPAAGVLALLVAVLSLFPAAFALGVAWLGMRGVGRACLAAPFLWTALELTRAHFLRTGFPWNLLGYAASENPPLLQLVSLAGIYGLSFLVAAYNALFAWVVMQRRSGRGRGALVLLIGLSAVLVVVGTLGERFIPQAQPTHRARLVQTNFPQSPSYPADWMEVHAGEMDELERLSTGPGERPADLTIWPETPAPFTLQDPKFAARAERIARIAKSPFLVGVVEWRRGPKGILAPFNSAALFNASGRSVFVYDKIHLVPFGEYVPLRRWLTFARKLTAEVGEFRPGSDYQVGEMPGGGRFGVFICYEAVFPNEVRRFVANGAGVLVNLSNDGWFGRSAAPEQHLAMARVRAVENRRWLLRATNNGYSVAVDPYGRCFARLAPDVRGALDAPYGFRSDLTLYSRWGDWLAWLCAGVSLLFVLLGAGQRAARDLRVSLEKRAS